MELMSKLSLCALGTTAVNPVLTTMQYFREEYEAHLRGRCPAKACRSLVTYYIDPETCQACRVCLTRCPAGAISGGEEEVYVIDQGKCTKCGTCFEVCAFDAVRKLSGEPVPPAPAPGTKPKKKEARK
jgi:NADH-quinone oxidoreductase subunit F